MGDKWLHRSGGPLNGWKTVGIVSKWTENSTASNDRLWTHLLALGGFLVGLSALGAAIYQSYELRKSNRIARAERLEFDATLHGGIFTLSMRNAGNGTAIVRWFQVLYDYGGDDNWTAASSWDDLFKFDQENRLTPYTFQVPWPETYLTPQEGWRNLFKIEDSEMASNFWKKLQNIQISACSCDVYDQCRVVVSNNREALPKLQCEGTISRFSLPPSFGSGLAP